MGMWYCEQSKGTAQETTAEFREMIQKGRQTWRGYSRTWCARKRHTIEEESEHIDSTLYAQAAITKYCKLGSL